MSQFCLIVSIRQNILKNEKNYTTKEIGWCRRLISWLLENGYYDTDLSGQPVHKGFEVSLYIDYLRTLGLSAHKVEVQFFCYLLHLSKCTVNKFEYRSWCISEPRKTRAVSLPVLEELASTIRNLSDDDGLFILLLFLSGRRSIDLKRLETRNVTVEGDRVHILLDYCKTRRHVTSYFFDFATDLPIDVEYYQRHFAALLLNNVQPFLNYDVEKLRTKISFKLHGLRSARAIFLLLEKLSPQIVQNRIGWACETTFKSYIRLPVSSILELGNYTAVADLLNKK